MWLKRLVGMCLIIACVGMNAVVVAGFFIPEKPVQIAAAPQPTPLPAPPPVVTLSVNPTTITAGRNSAVSWTTTGNAESCVASGSWAGPKTPFGSESTGRISRAGNYVYTLTCKNAGGTGSAEAVINVGGVAPVAAAKPTSNTSATQPTYCSGRIPCYGPHDLSAHSGSGNCWGYNVDRVINLSAFDLGFHSAKSGIPSIQLASICGKNLAPALSGSVSSGGQTRDHNPSSKANADRNMIPYFVGYFDTSKP